LFVEWAGNDGIMLHNFQERGIRHLGVEPSVNVAERARQTRYSHRKRILQFQLADKIVAETRPGRTQFSPTNVCATFPISGCRRPACAACSSPMVSFMFRRTHIWATCRQDLYDQIYDEHVFHLSALSIKRAFAVHGLDG